jgi:hypothetical protein
MATPLRPRTIFQGSWHGPGRLVPLGVGRLFHGVDPLEFRNRFEWVSDTLCVVDEAIDFASGRAMRRRMFVQLTAPDRMWVTADDLPGGAEIRFHDWGYDFSRYTVLAPFAGRHWPLRCRDVNRLDERGRVVDVVRMTYLGLPLVRLELGPLERGG